MIRIRQSREDRETRELVDKSCEQPSRLPLPRPSPAVLSMSWSRHGQCSVAIAFEFILQRLELFMWRSVEENSYLVYASLEDRSFVTLLARLV
jgi:hypothetical protein